MEGSGKRVKFKLAPVEGLFDPGEARHELLYVASEMEKSGCAPVLPDGKVAGNLGAVRYQNGILVSRSGKAPGHASVEDFVYVIGFDGRKWEAVYMPLRPGAEPTSDTPLYWAALVEVPAIVGRKGPAAAVQGHALSTEGDAKRFGIPISTEETEFSTPEERAALIGLMCEYQYPEYRIWIRKGHGFFAAGESLRKAFDTARPYIERARLSR